MRFDLQFQTMRRFFDDGDLGEIMAAEAYYAHDLRDIYDITPWRLSVPQDLMFGGVVHPVDILRCFLGDVGEVHAYGAKGKLTPEFPQPRATSSSICSSVAGKSAVQWDCTTSFIPPCP